MEPRSIVATGVIAVLLVTTIGLAVAETDSSSTADNATLSVGADATVELSPDLATVTVEAVGHGETAQEARTNLSSDATAVEEALEDAGANVTSSRFRISPEYEHTDKGREQVGYVAVHTIEAETSSVESVGSLVDTAVDAGADRVDGITYDLTDERRAQARKAALTDAMGSARTDAETLAAAENRTVGAAITVTTDNAEIDRPVVHRELAAGDAGGATAISPSDVTVDASVQVTYRLN
jgi:uncharacterized protein YggE